MRDALCSVLLLLAACGPEAVTPAPAPAPAPAPEAPPLAVEIGVRPGLHDLVAVASADGAAVPVAWAWTRDGGPTDEVTERVAAPGLFPGERWEATAIAEDGRTASAAVEVPAPPGGNVLLVILDDVGVDKLGIYGAADPPVTPTIDGLAARGVVFRDAWAAPTCSPTRANLLTGRYGSRTGIGVLLDMDDDTVELPLDALTLPEALADARSGPWSTSAVGKWHLSTKISPSAGAHPRLSGFGWYSGSLGYLVRGAGGPTDVDGYFRWDKTRDDASVDRVDVYNTTDSVDDAIARIAAMPEPFLLWLALNAPHTPLHVPPADLHVRAVTDDSPAPDLLAAMLEAADAELGRLLSSIDPAVLADTTIIVLGDNGTSEVAVSPPLDPERAKGSVYEGGVHVPLIVAGPLVGRPGESHALVHAVDVFATVAEIAGVPLVDVPGGQAVVAGGVTRRIDGIGLLPWMTDPDAPSAREVLYSEGFTPNGPPPWSIDRTVRDARWKLVRAGGRDQLFRLIPGAPDEGPDLLPLRTPEVLAAWSRLARALDAEVADLPYEGE